MHGHPIHGWRRCRARAGVDAAAAPSVLAAYCVASHKDGAATTAKIAGPPSEHNGRARRPKAQNSTTERKRLRDLVRSNITLVGKLICRLVNLQPNENMVIDHFEGVLYNSVSGLACKVSYHGFSLMFLRAQSTYGVLTAKVGSFGEPTPKNKPSQKNQDVFLSDAESDIDYDFTIKKSSLISPISYVVF